MTKKRIDKDLCDLLSNLERIKLLNLYHDDYPMISEKRKQELAEKIKGRGLPLPPEVSCRKEILPTGKPFYIFRHVELGDLGRMLIVPNGNESQFMFEVTGEEDDPMTDQKKAVFEPIAHDIGNLMESILGKGKGTFKPYKSPEQRQEFIGERIMCKKCDTTVAFLVYAPPNATESTLQDYGRIGFAKGKEFGVQTWVISEEDLVNNQGMPRLLTLKVFPERETTKPMLASELDDILCPLVEYHCKRGPK